MHRTLAIGLGTAVALATAAVAVAVAPSVSGISETTASFGSLTVGDVKTRTCTDGTGPTAKTYVTTDGRYTGTLTSPQSVLDGPLTIRLRTTSSGGLGYVIGSFRVKDDDSRVSGVLTGTLKGTSLVGFITATSRGNHAKLLGNLSATLVPGTTFTDGRIGTGSVSQLAVIAGPLCKGSRSEGKSRPDDKSKSERKSDRSSRPVHVEGVVTASVTTGAQTITVTSKRGHETTCSVGAGSPSIADFPLQTNVEMKCENVGTPAVLTLKALKKHT